MLGRNQPLALYMEGNLIGDFAKMGHGILRYSPNPIACCIDSQYAGKRAQEVFDSPTDCPVVATVDEAKALGAEVMVLGIAPPGGLIPESWYPTIDEAVAKGLSIINGLHDLVGPRYPNLPTGQWIWDIRIEPPGLGVATAQAARLQNRRVLLIGTDMAIGKMTAGLEIQKLAQSRGVTCEFVATGQIGITITGTGVPLDAIRVDFAAGAIEREVLRFAHAEVVLIEGQGALCHPASTANLPLLRGSMPTHLILCHRAGQTHLRRLPEIPLPPLREYVRLYEDLASVSGIFPRPKTVAVALNTVEVHTDDEARDWVKRTADEIGLPCTDPIRFGCAELVDAILA